MSPKSVTNDSFKILCRFCANSNQNRAGFNVPWMTWRLQEPILMTEASSSFIFNFLISLKNLRFEIGPSIEIWINFVELSSLNPSLNALTRSSERVWTKILEFQQRTTIFVSLTSQCLTRGSTWLFYEAFRNYSHFHLIKRMGTNWSKL